MPISHPVVSRLVVSKLVVSRRWSQGQLLGASGVAVHFMVGGLAGGDLPVSGLAVGGLTVGSLGWWSPCWCVWWCGSWCSVCVSLFVCVYRFKYVNLSFGVCSAMDVMKVDPQVFEFFVNPIQSQNLQIW